MTQLIRGLNNITSSHKGGVVTIGNFDGVHIGHQALIKSVIEKAKRLQVPSTVITFEPQPLEFFKQTPVARLTRWREKFLNLQKTGLDNVVVLRFNQQFANLSAEEFIQLILVKGLAVKHIIVGDDFRFGRERQGDFHFLKTAGQQWGFSVKQSETVLIEGERVSSTRIRQALFQGNNTLADRLLGRPYSMVGRIVHGDKLGRKLGFPTANIYLHRALAPVQGIYTVKMRGIATKALPGVANVGIRPTVGGTRALLEVYLLDFDGDIYGRTVEVEFCKKLRDEVYFPELELLKDAIAKDVEAARHYFQIR